MLERYYSMACSLIIFSGMIIAFYYHTKIYFSTLKNREQSIGSFELKKLKQERDLLFKTNPRIQRFRKKYRIGILLILFGLFAQIVYWIINSAK